MGPRFIRSQSKEELVYGGTRDPLAHRTLDEQFQSINTFAQSFDYSILLIKRKNHYLSFEN